MSVSISYSTTGSTPMDRSPSNSENKKIPIRDQHLVNGYLREQQHKLFHTKSSKNNYYTLHSVNVLILMYYIGQCTLDRYGFLIEHMLAEQTHRKLTQKENQRLLKWQDMIFPKKK
eukprot:201768_1